MNEPATIQDGDGTLTTGGPTSGTPVRPVAPPVLAPPPLPPPLTIPGGDPAAVALTILSLCNGSAAAEIRGRITGLDHELGSLVESARLDVSMTVVRFAKRAARSIKARGVLQDRLWRLEGSPGISDRPPVEVEIQRLARAVKRWRDGRELSREGAGIIGKISLSLDAVDGEIQGIIASYRQGCVFQPDRAAAKAGLAARDDEFLRRVEKRLRTRASLAARLARLDPGGNDKRASHVADVVAAAGGPEALREQLKPVVPADTRKLTEAQREITSLGQQLTEVDPESQRAEALEKRRSELKARMPGLAEEVEFERGKAADAIVRVAALGIQAGIANLAVVARGVVAGLAERLEALGTTDPELEAVVAELIAP